MRTITLKLHKPGKRKRLLIEEAMLNYSRAYSYLLERAAGDIEEIRRAYADGAGRYRGAFISKWVDRDLSRELNAYSVEPFKDSLKIDFGMTLAGYLNLLGTGASVGYPEVFMGQEELDRRFRGLVNELDSGAGTLEQCLRELERSRRKAGALKPLFFCRHAVNRDYCLLYDEGSGRYYVKLYLLNARGAVKADAVPFKNREMTYIHKSGSKLEPRTNKERFILAPLSFGKWQESFLRKALEKPEMIRTARLFKRDGEYYLAVSLFLEDEPRWEIRTYTGVARGLTKLLELTTVDKAGEILHRVGLKEGAAGAPEAVLDGGSLHRLANGIVEIAVKHRSQVIAEALALKGDMLKWSDAGGRDVYPLLSSKSYNELLGILEYKLVARGLPPPVKVSPLDIFYRCPQCGGLSRKSRFTKDMFICVTCGKAMEIEALGSLNLAMKLISYQRSRIKVKSIREPEGIRFVNRELGLDFTARGTEDCIGEFLGETARLIETLKEEGQATLTPKEYKKRKSIIRKLEAEEDLLNAIEFV